LITIVGTPASVGQTVGSDRRRSRSANYRYQRAMVR
jgi:hypothetical protein